MIVEYLTVPDNDKVYEDQPHATSVVLRSSQHALPRSARSPGVPWPRLPASKTMYKGTVLDRGGGAKAFSYNLNQRSRNRTCVLQRLSEAKDCTRTLERLSSESPLTRKSSAGIASQ